MSAIARIEEKDPWDPVPGESAKTYRAFAAFRDLGVDRSIPEAAGLLKLSIPYLHELSAKYHWFDRAGAYDVYLDRRRRAARETAIDQAERVERGIGLSLERVVMERLQGKGNPKDEGYVPPLSPGELDAQAVARLAETGVRIRRQADGQATDYVRAATSVSSAEAERLVRVVVEEALPLISEEQHERFLMGVKARLTGGTR